MRFVDYIKQLVRLNNYESDALRGEVQALRDQHFAVESKAPHTDEQAQAASRIATLRACIRWNTNYRLITIERNDDTDTFRLCNDGSLNEPAIEINAPHDYSDAAFYGSFQMERAADIIKRLRKGDQK